MGLVGYTSANVVMLDQIVAQTDVGRLVEGPGPNVVKY